MRTAAQVVPIAVEIDLDLFVARQVGDDLGLVRLADGFEMRDRFVARPHLAPRRQIGRDEFLHLRFDLGQIVGRERIVPREVVEEPILDIGTDGHLRAGIERLHRLRQKMRAIVPDEVERVGLVLQRDDRDFRVVADRQVEIGRPPVDLDRERGLGEAGTDGSGNLRAGNARRERSHRAVGQGDTNVDCGCRRGHVSLLLAWKARTFRAKPPQVKKWACGRRRGRWASMGLLAQALIHPIGKGRMRKPPEIHIERSTISTRRLRLRPASAPFDFAGESGPTPCADRRSREMPYSVVRAVTTAVARSRASAML